jgi:uncharacterized protein (TIGR02145 family)
MSLFKQAAFILSVVILSVGIGYLAIAWTDAPGDPPGCPADYPGCNTPLNVSITAQAKQGALVLGANPAVETGLIVQHGNVGIGTTVPGYRLDVNGTFRVQVQCGDNVTFTYKGGQVTYGTVESQGKCWMDRNLGASQVATSSTDSVAYGDLFQWGRLDDGHQTRTSGTTPTLSSTDNPGHSNFILSGSSPYDWRSPQNNNLWQGVSGINNPCPSGWRIPTETEWETERLSWSSNDLYGAFASPLKLTVGGYRHNLAGNLANVGSNGYYWSYTVSSTYARYLSFISTNAYMGTSYRAGGSSVRCVQDDSVSANTLLVNNGKVGIGTPTPGQKLTVAGTIESTSGGFKFPDASIQATAAAGVDPAAIVALPVSPGSPYSLNWNAIQVCQFGTCCPPWKDCDGDGKTYAAGTDCDEGCSTCWVGNTTGLAESDGKDQNCNGVIDELGGEFLAKTCNPCASKVRTETVVASCQNYCASLGRGYIRYTMDYCAASCNHLYLDYNFSTCTASTSTTGNVPSCAGNNFRCYCQAAL